MSDPSAITYRFEGVELDSSRFELRVEGEPRHVEPQVLSLLLLLAANPDRLVSKDEIVEKVWHGRIVSEAAISTRIKAARQAIGDDGRQQRLIRTVHGRGFRFAGQVDFAPGAASGPEARAAGPEDRAFDPPPDLQRGRPSIAVLPLAQVGEALPHGIIADALPAEIIMDLARLRWLFVIARGSSFRFRSPDADVTAVGRALSVRYCLTGTIEAVGEELRISLSLAETARGELLWSDRYSASLAEWPALREEVCARVVGKLSDEIRVNEARLARGRPASELGAWSAFHLGLDHMYRFNRADNNRAAELFQQALTRDGDFSAALGGLSFTHFQNAFLGYAESRSREVEQARVLAHRAVETDRLDPFAHFNLARSFWLEGNLADSREWFDRVHELSPSFAQGVYNRGLVAVLDGDAAGAMGDLELAMQLSPLDPLLYAMVSSKALCLLETGDLAEASRVAERAALTPGAHQHIALIAALAAHLAGDGMRTRLWLDRARERDPTLDRAKFFRAFPYTPGAGRERIERALTGLGL